MNIDDLKNLSNQFIIEIERRKSESYVTLYKASFLKFFSFLERESSLQNEILDDFARYLVRDGCQINSIYFYLNRIYSFFDYLFLGGYSKLKLSKKEFNKISAAYKIYKKNIPRTLLTDKEIISLFEYWESYDKNPIQKYRNLVILRLLLYGISAGEISTLKLEHIVRENKFLIIAGRRKRVIRLDNETLSSLFEYLSLRNVLSPWLFLPLSRYSKKSISVRAIERIVDYTVEECGIDKNISPRTFRNTLISRRLADGLPYSAVSQELGNVSTLSYIGFNNPIEGELEVK